MKMRHADALSRHINYINEVQPLSGEVTSDNQEGDTMCQKYKDYDDFFLDDNLILYRKSGQGRPCIVIRKSLVPTVLKCYNDSPFTAHQGEARTRELIKLKY
jgi:hypothetical protein